MLQHMHDRYKGWVAWAIIILIAITFAAWGIESYFNSARYNDVAAKVNGIVIKQQEVASGYERARNQLQQKFGSNFSLTPDLIRQLKQNVLQELVVNLLIKQSGRKNGYIVSAQSAGNTIMSIPDFKENGEFSPKKYESILRNSNLSPETFLEQVKFQMLMNQLNTGLTTTAFVLPYEIAEVVSFIEQKRDIDYVIISSKSFAGKIQNSLKDQKNYYQKHLTEFNTPEKISLEYVQLTLNDLVAQQEVSDTEIKEYYESNIKNYEQPKSWLISQILIRLPANPTAEQIQQATQKLQSIAQQIKSGKSFEKLAKQYSDDVLTAKQGGVMPWFKAGMTIDPVFENTANNLKIGEISQPVQSKYGMHLIRLLAVKEGQRKPLENAHAEIKKMLAKEKAQQLFANRLEELANAAYMNPDSLQPTVQNLNLTLQTTPVFTHEGLTTGIASNPAILKAAFSDAVLKNGSNSEVIQLNPETAVVIRIKTYEKPTPRPFETVQAEIQKRLAVETQRTAAEKLAVKITNGLKNNDETLFKEQKLNWITLSKVKRNANKNAPAEILNAAFELSNPVPNQTPPLLAFSLKSGDAVIVKVKAVYPGDIKDLSAVQKQILSERLQEQSGQTDYDLYIQDLIQRAKIKVNNLDDVETNNG